MAESSSQPLQLSHMYALDYIASLGTHPRTQRSNLSMAGTFQAYGSGKPYLRDESARCPCSSPDLPCHASSCEDAGLVSQPRHPANTGGVLRGEVSGTSRLMNSARGWANVDSSTGSQVPRSRGGHSGSPPAFVHQLGRHHRPSSTTEAESVSEARNAAVLGSQGTRNNLSAGVRLVKRSDSMRSRSLTTKSSMFEVTSSVAGAKWTPGRLSPSKSVHDAVDSAYDPGANSTSRFSSATAPLAPSDWANSGLREKPRKDGQRTLRRKPVPVQQPRNAQHRLSCASEGSEKCLNLTQAGVLKPECIRVGMVQSAKKRLKDVGERVLWPTKVWRK